MKFQVTSSCLHSGGQHAQEGDVIEIPDREAAILHQAGRGHPAATEPPAAPADPPAKDKGKK